MWSRTTLAALESHGATVTLILSRGGENRTHLCPDPKSGGSPLAITPNKLKQIVKDQMN